METAPKRKFSRVEFKIVATVKHDQREFVGAVSNLSLGGVFLVTDQQLPVGEVADILIALDDQPENSVEMTGKVARATEEGIAFNFEKIDYDSFIHLKNLVALNSGDEGKIQGEMVDHVVGSAD
ncbi:MAG: PilZ domain-containing protein [Holophagales bacterium]|nr:PilZ domain-containing protein [Holophagales bacterium]